MNKDLLLFFCKPVGTLTIDTLTNGGDSWTLYFNPDGKLVRVESKNYGRFESKDEDDLGCLYKIEENPAYKKRLQIYIQNEFMRFTIERNYIPYDYSWNYIQEGCVGPNASPTRVIDKKILAKKIKLMADVIENGGQISETEAKEIIQDLINLKG